MRTLAPSHDMRLYWFGGFPIWVTCIIWCDHMCFSLMSCDEFVATLNECFVPSGVDLLSLP